VDRSDQRWTELGRSMAPAGSPLEAADLLCHACVEFLEVDGASISVFHDGTSRGTFGSSDEVSRVIDSIQFTLGEGPCFDVIRDGRAVFAPDLDDPDEQRWPVFSGEAIGHGVVAVFALPVSIAAARVGALELYRRRRGELGAELVAGGELAAGLAAMPLFELMTGGTDWSGSVEEPDVWDELASLERVEVYQAMGMIMEMLDVGSTEALLRLRGHALATGGSAADVARAVVERRLVLESDTPGPHPRRTP
jgi:hypothetical protein